MIPKIIHLCWLSGDKFPDSIIKCLDTWLEHLSDYEVWMWSSPSTTQESQEANGNAKYYDKIVPFDVNSTIWTKQAFEAKKYAFAADYIRLYALYNYGGIYLDADVIVYKPFDELLCLPYFIGADRIGSFEAAVIGCEKCCMWIGDIFERYQNMHFVKEDGGYDMYPLPGVFRNVLINKGYNFIRISNLRNIVNYRMNEQFLSVFDADFFNSRDHLRVRRTNKSFCAHNYLGTWAKKENMNVKDNIKVWIPNLIANFFIEISHYTWNRHKYDNIKIPFSK